MKKNIFKIIIMLAILTFILLYFFNNHVNKFINNIFEMFGSGDFSAVENFISEYGAYAMLVSAGLMILQSVVAFFPTILIAFANASLFGWWKGAILSLVSSMLGATLCFHISRILGRDTAERLADRMGLNQIDDFFEKYGKHSILIARLLPFMPYDLVSYAAGFTSISFTSFIIATGIGQLPATIIYSYVGGMFTKGLKFFVTGLTMFFALSVLTVLLSKIFHERQSSKNNRKESNHEI